MARARKGGKKYGPVKKRGLCWRVRQQARQANSRREAVKPTWYTVPAGAAVHVRKLNSQAEWQPHTTKMDVRCCGYLWRNRGHYGFVQGEWELKVAVRDLAADTPRS